MKKKIIFVAPSLVGGGAEKVLVDIIGALDHDKHELFLILFDKCTLVNLSFILSLFLIKSLSLNSITPESIVNILSMYLYL